MCVCASSGSRSGTSTRKRSNQWRMPSSETTPGRLTPGPHVYRRPPDALQAGLRDEQVVARLAVLVHERDATLDRHEQSLGVHVRGLDLGHVEPSLEQVRHLLAVLGEVLPVHHGWPDGLLELALAV